MGRDYRQNRSQDNQNWNISTPVVEWQIAPAIKDGDNLLFSVVVVITQQKGQKQIPMNVIISDFLMDTTDLLSNIPKTDVNRSTSTGRLPVKITVKDIPAIYSLSVAFIWNDQKIWAHETITIPKKEVKKLKLDIIDPTMDNNYRFKFLISLKNEDGNFAEEVIRFESDLDIYYKIGKELDGPISEDEICCLSDKYLTVSIDFDGKERLIKFFSPKDNDMKEFRLDRIKFVKKERG